MTTMNRSAAADYWKLLDDFEDLLAGGWRRSNASAPRLAGDSVPSAASALEELAAEVRACRRCALHSTRSQAVPGVGSSCPALLVIGEGPGAEEDRRGEPFVGKAGQFLDKWLEAIGLSRASNVYITNIVKCRPPDNRDPLPAESAACLPYLERQIEALAPPLILTLGRIALGRLLGVTEGITAVHGRWFDYRGIPVLATFHPSAVLRDPSLKRPVWEDLKKLRDRLEA